MPPELCPATPTPTLASRCPSERPCAPPPSPSRGVRSLPPQVSRQQSENQREQGEVLPTPNALSSTSRALLSLKPADSAPVSDRLYKQGMHAKRARAAAARQAEERELDNPDLTFAPTLSSTSLALVDAQREERRLADEDPWSYHHLEHHRRAQAQLHLSRLYARDEMRENTFQPRIGRASIEIARERRSGSAPPSRRRAEAPRAGPIHASLHEDHRYKKRHLLLRESQTEAQIEEKARSRSVKLLRRESLDRLVHSNETKEEELEALRQYLHRDQVSQTQLSPEPVPPLRSGWGGGSGQG